MKVGIITLWGRFNYGNRLQNYATNRIWNAQGFDAETLFLTAQPKPPFSLRRTVRKILYRDQIESPEESMTIDRLQAFDAFNCLIPSRQIEVVTDELADEYDLFSVGSDQVWNPDMVAFNNYWVFLEFARPRQRIALAPSIGLDTLNRGQQRWLAHGVQGFDVPSIREKRGADLIERCSGASAEVICDPTLVIRPEDWRGVACNRLTPDEPYIFTYLLGEANEDVRSLLAKLTHNGSIAVISLSDRERSGELPAGPAEFIGLIEHASHVITDSFHAAVFSCLFETPLTIVKRGGDGSGIFSRLETLAQSLGIQDKIFGASSFDLCKAQNYDGVSERILAEREHFLSYLNDRVKASNE